MFERIEYLNLCLDIDQRANRLHILHCVMKSRCCFRVWPPPEYVCECYRLLRLSAFRSSLRCCLASSLRASKAIRMNTSGITSAACIHLTIRFALPVLAASVNPMDLLLLRCFPSRSTVRVSVLVA
jgi:hypothetical protein